MADSLMKGLSVHVDFLGDRDRGSGSLLKVQIFRNL